MELDETLAAIVTGDATARAATDRGAKVAFVDRRDERDAALAVAGNGNPAGEDVRRDGAVRMAAR